MREIKFRAWDTKDNKMRKVISIEYGLSTDTSLDLSQCIFIGLSRVIGERFNLLCKPPRIHLMQYTGLKGKNGKEIYEGDIVKTGNKDSLYQWVWEAPYFELRRIKDNFSAIYIADKGVASMEVIGNIYENPEFLNLQKGSQDEDE